MKAIILAAGKGERLKEITVRTPKPMIEFLEKPVLQYNVELCKKYGVNEIYINLHHLHEKITDYFGDGKKFGVQIKYSFEEELLGTAGAVKKIAKEYWKFNSGTKNKSTNQQLNNQKPFYVIYGDQISNFDLILLKNKYKEQVKLENGCVGIIGFHYREDVEHSGVAEFDRNKRIIKFIEKPKAGETDSHWVNAGVYYINPSVIDFIFNNVSDFGKDVFPFLLNKNLSLYGVCEYKNVSVFDTPEMYSKTINPAGEKYE